MDDIHYIIAVIFNMLNSLFCSTGSTARVRKLSFKVGDTFVELNWEHPRDTTLDETKGYIVVIL